MVITNLKHSMWHYGGYAHPSLQDEDEPEDETEDTSAEDLEEDEDEEEEIA